LASIPKDIKKRVALAIDELVNFGVKASNTKETPNAISWVP
jgi:hypothetical protein